MGKGGEYFVRELKPRAVKGRNVAPVSGNRKLGGMVRRKRTVLLVATDCQGVRGVWRWRSSRFG